MQGLINRIGHFLQSHTVWIFVTTIIFVSFQRILFFRHADIGESMVYLSIEKWQLYFLFSGSILVLFLPVLSFSYFRKSLKKQLNIWIYRLLWIYCFVLHGFLMFYFKVDHFFAALRVHVDPLLVFIIAILLVELIIHFNDFLLQKLTIQDRLQKIGIEKAIWVFMVAVALIFSLHPYLREMPEHRDFANFKGEIIILFLKWLLLFSSIYFFYRINHYLLVEKVFKTKGIFYYLFAFLGLAMLFFPIFAIIIGDFLPTGQTLKIAPEYWIPKGERTTWFYVFPTSVPWTFMLWSIPVILVYQWWKQQNDIVSLEKEKSTAELNALKQQVNPHFLFNTLNSLYALGIEEKGAKTADGIAKLGTLMRYNLSDAQKDLISLQKELDYIKKYIELQELRVTSNNDLRINIINNGMEGYLISPMLLIPFIENAFKFGISATENTIIDLKIKLEEKILVMEVFNTIIPKRQQGKGNGIGINNVRKRLAHLYPDQYELIIEESPKEFEVHLTIPLIHDSSHSH